MRQKDTNKTVTTEDKKNELERNCPIIIITQGNCWGFKGDGDVREETNRRVPNWGPNKQ